MGELLAKLIGLVVIGVVLLFVVWFGGVTWLAENMVADWDTNTIQEAYSQGPDSKNWKMLQDSVARATALQDQCRASAATGKHTSDETQCAVAGRTLKAWSDWKAHHPN